MRVRIRVRVRVRVRGRGRGRLRVRVSTPHARVVRPESGGLAVVEKGVVRHGQDLVRLTQAVPRAVVLGVDVDGMAVGVHRGRGVLELDKLVAHEGPCGEEVLVELERAPGLGVGLGLGLG